MVYPIMSNLRTVNNFTNGTVGFPKHKKKDHLLRKKASMFHKLGQAKFPMVVWF